MTADVPHVVFLRGVNVGGHKKFQPAALARDLSKFGVVNVGAAGTFVARKVPSVRVFRAALLEKLPFEAAVAILPASDLEALAAGDPFPGDSRGDDVRRMLTILLATPKERPRLPIRRPEGDDWQIELVGHSGRFVTWLWRPNPANLQYTDAAEKAFGVPATSRSWNTIEKIRKILAGG